MARETLPAALKLLFGDEGGYSNKKTDKGGPTKYGITHKTLAAHRGVKSVSAASVEAMTLAEAADIYELSYWSQSGGDLLPIGLDYETFDFGVNSGPSRGVMELQKVLGVAVDGSVGGETLQAIDTYPGGIEKLIRDYADQRMRFLRSLGGKQGFSVNGRGWTIRVTGIDPLGKWKSTPGVVGNAIALARKAPIRVTTVSDPAGAPKASTKSTSIVETLKKPEAWAPAGGLLTAIGGFAAGTGPVQWAIAAAMLIGVSYGVYRLVQRDRAEA